jgi:hypothetical protein
VTPSVIPGSDNTDKTCEVVFPGTTELKVEPFTQSGSESDGTLSVTWTKPSQHRPDGVTSDNNFDWTSNIPVVGVIVKNGVDGANSYDYGTPGSTGDDYLSTPNEGDKGISNVKWCYIPGQPSFEPLTAEKTADGTYDRTVEWTLDKSVDPSSLSGVAGQVFDPVTWEVKADKTETLSNYKVSGEITITNVNTIPVDVEVSDVLDDAAATAGAVDCSPLDGDQPYGTVPAAGSAGDGELTCTYTASPPDMTATVNTATITSKVDAVPGTEAKADVEWKENLVGYDSGTLSDPRFDFEQLIDDDYTTTFSEGFECPLTSSGKYVNGVYDYTETNTAYLNGGIKLDASAKVDVRCVQEWKGETATGQGAAWPGSNWFMYTPFAAGPVDLVAGQNYDVGDIYMTRNPDGKTTDIRIDLGYNGRFAAVPSNLKIEVMSKAPTAFKAPGSFKYKFNVSTTPGAEVTVTVPNGAFYGIHADVERALK